MGILKMSNIQAIFLVPVFVSSRWSKAQIQKNYDPGKYMLYDDQYINTSMYMHIKLCNLHLLP